VVLLYAEIGVEQVNVHLFKLLHVYAGRALLSPHSHRN